MRCDGTTFYFTVSGHISDVTLIVSSMDFNSKEAGVKFDDLRMWKHVNVGHQVAVSTGYWNIFSHRSSPSSAPVAHIFNMWEMSTFTVVVWLCNWIIDPVLPLYLFNRSVSLLMSGIENGTDRLGLGWVAGLFGLVRCGWHDFCF